MRNWLPLNGYQSYKQITKTGLLNASPPIVLAVIFLALILIGTILLSLPAATHHPITIFTALFTATSAVTVTGLTIADPGTTFTFFGQVVLLLLIQTGGLGFVTFAVVAALTLGKRISLKQQALVLEAFNQTSVPTIQRTAFAVLKIAISIQAIGIIVLTLWWWRQSTFTAALYKAVFYSISAFNNSGFSLHADSLTRYVNDPVVILTISLLVITGGVGFTVLSDVSDKRRWTTLRPYTKIILLTTLALNLAGFFLIWVLEFNNPDTFGHLPLRGQALAAWLHSVATRTAGFNSVDISELTDSTTLVMMMLMFIGGGSLSTASGIKIGTFIVLIAAAASYISRRREVVLFKRSISPDIVQKSLALLLVYTALIFIGLFFISVFDDAPFLSILFEVISAISTTGMARDLTPNLSTTSQSIIMVLMYAGRLGPLTLVYSLATQSRSRIRYPETEMQVG